MEDPQHKVIIIDDDILITNSISFYLEEHGFDVIEAADGKQGLEAFLEEKPDIVITDLHMPEMDGYEVLEYISHHFPHVPLIVFTGAGTVSSVIEATNIGAWEIILKPVRDMELVLNAVKKVWKRATGLQQSFEYTSQLEEQIRNLKFDLELCKTDELKTGVLVDRIEHILSQIKESLDQKNNNQEYKSVDIAGMPEQAIELFERIRKHVLDAKEVLQKYRQ
jgi:DNA-binding response OmpR family regulator